MYYYAKKINEDVPISEVMGLYALDNRTRGNIKCPDPKHNDKKPSAKIYENTNVCRCFTCNKSYKPIDIVMIMEGLSANELPKACEILCDRFGLDKRVYGEGFEDEKTGDVFPFTGYEMELIGLKEGMKYSTFEFLGETIKTPTLFDLYKFGTEDTNREFLQEMVIGKAKDKKEVLKENIEWLKGVMEDFEKTEDFEEKKKLYEAHLEYKKSPDYNGNIEKILPKGMSKEEGVNKIITMIEHIEDFQLLDTLNRQLRLCDTIIEKAEKMDLTEEQQMWTIKPKKHKAKGVDKCS